MDSIAQVTISEWPFVYVKSCGQYARSYHGSNVGQTPKNIVLAIHRVFHTQVVYILLYVWTWAIYRPLQSIHKSYISINIYTWYQYNILEIIYKKCMVNWVIPFNLRWAFLPTYVWSSCISSMSTYKFIVWFHNPSCSFLPLSICW